jgi:regulator of sigma E protease
MGVTVLSFIIVMGIVVFVHELGHFLAAKRNGIVVEEFGFGFPPRLFKLFERNGTIYSINIIPFGGFVRMRGEDDPSLPGSFASASKRARATTLLAGSTMNFLLAIVLFTAVIMLAGIPNVLTTTTVKEIMADTPAAQAGMQPGDRIIGAGDVSFAAGEDLRKHTEAHRGQPVAYRVARGDQTLTLTMTPRLEIPPNQGPLGVVLDYQVTYRAAALPEATWTAVRTTGAVIWMTLQIPATLIRERRPIGDAGLLGPVGIAAVTGDVVRSARTVDPILQLVAALSVALGFTNLLPIPALDGGRLLFVLVEAIRRKRIEPAREGLVHLIGFGFALLLLGVVTVREIGQLLTDTFPYTGLR